jgi:hypothetical protein
MKKKLLSLICLPVAASLATLAACSGSSQTIVPTSSNWYRGGSDGIQPSIICQDESEVSEKAEILTYNVSLSDGTASYQVSTGTYTTRLYAVTYDWSKSLADYASNTTEVVYVYETELTITGTYGTDKKAFNDLLKTKTYFRSAAKNLQPIYSYEDIKSTSPTSTVTFAPYSYTIETWYNAATTQATTTQTYRADDPRYDTANSQNNVTTTTASLSGASYSVFDLNMMYLAARSFKLTSSYSSGMSVYVPNRGALSTVTVKGTDSGTLEATDSMRAVLVSAYAPTATDIDYVDISLSKTNQSTITARYAAISNTNDNQCRSTLLQLKTSIGYSFGTLTYTLATIHPFPSV